ncbi:hypothetical protein [Peribacillus acanthi]|nr:hypothetical protein [Peribacillus acanthi]
MYISKLDVDQPSDDQMTKLIFSLYKIERLLVVVKQGSLCDMKIDI